MKEAVADPLSYLTQALHLEHGLNAPSASIRRTGSFLEDLSPGIRCSTLESGDCQVFVTNLF